MTCFDDIWYMCSKHDRHPSKFNNQHTWKGMCDFKEREKITHVE